MRKMTLFLAVLAALVMPVTMAMAQTGHPTSCGACHAPHGSGLLEGVPLWDGHDVDGVPFDMYGEGAHGTVTLDMTAAAEPDGSARLCLSCHDGDPDDFVPGLTHDLTDDHPISFTYDTVLANADGELRDPASYAVNITNTLLGTSSSGVIGDKLLYGTGKMQCVSCHDIHTSGSTTFLLQNVNATVIMGSHGPVITDLCRACHIK